MMNPLNQKETTSLRELQKSLGRNARKTQDHSIFELRAGAIGKLLDAAQAPTPPQPAYPPVMPMPPGLGLPVIDWDGKAALMPNHRVEQGVVMVVYGNQVCVKSSKFGGLTVFKFQEITPPVDNFDKLAAKIHAHQTQCPTTVQTLAAILRELHAKEDLFQVIGVARES